MDTPYPSIYRTTMRGKTILQVLPSLDSGGVERGTIEMVQAISREGGTALVASAGGRMMAQVERAGGRHVAMSLMTKDPVNILLNAGRLARLVRAGRVDLVHARSRAPAWSAWMAARRVSVPFVTTWHGVYSAGLPGKRLYNGIMARGDRVIAISRFVAARVETEYGVDPARIRTIPRGVDTAIFDPAAVGGERVHRLAQAWRIPAGARVVMLPARLTRWKGAEILLRAVAGLQEGLRATCFVVLVGDQQGRASYARDLTGLAEHLGIASRLRLAGHCDDMPAALLLAELVVSASLKPEPFGRSIIEAQAMGRPVVAFDHGGAAETIEHGVTGWRAPPGDLESLSASIAGALGLDAVARGLVAERARASVLEHFTTRIMQDATMAVYRELFRG